MAQNTPNAKGFKIFGTDVTKPESWLPLADLYLLLRDTPSRNDIYAVDELEDRLNDFPAADPESAVELVEALSEHTHPAVRDLAGRIAVRDLASKPRARMDITRSARVIAHILSQAEEWPNIVADCVWDEVINNTPDIGIVPLTEITQEYNAAVSRLQPPGQDPAQAPGI